MCWAGDSGYVGAREQYSWYMDLPKSGSAYEQVIYNHAVYLDTVVINTYINDTSAPSSCDATVPKGFSFPFKALTGSWC